MDKNPEINNDKIGEDLNNIPVQENPARDFMYFVLDLLKTGVIVFILAFALRYFAVQPFIVDGESMESSFVNNEYLLAEKMSYIFSQPKRGDVVVFRYPNNPSVSYIKRIIGLPGETVKIVDKKVMVENIEYPEGKILNEQYLDQSTITVTNESNFSVTLGTDEYFVLGDNREHSSDSREWGKLPRKNIIGRAWLTVIPLDRFGVQKRIQYSVFDKFENKLALFGAFDFK